MKKIFLVIISAIFLSGALFAQEEIPAAKSSKNFRIGGMLNVQPVIGELANYTPIGLGGGLNFEYDLPVGLPQNIKIGIPAAVYANMNILQTDMVSSMLNIQANTGIYVRFIMSNGAFILQPELDYGASMYILKRPAYYEQHIKPFYLDQMIQVALGIRFAPKNILNGRMEMSVTPIYTLSPEVDDLVHYIGVRIGVLFR